jgi:hypothetical protein
MKSRWGISVVGVLIVASLARVIYADARDDLGRAKSDYGAVKSHYDHAKSKLESYVDDSVKLRAMDKDYGKQKNKDMQSSFSCDEKEIALSADRRDNAVRPRRREPSPGHSGVDHRSSRRAPVSTTRIAGSSRCSARVAAWWQRLSLDPAQRL